MLRVLYGIILLFFFLIENCKHKDSQTFINNIINDSTKFTDVKWKNPMKDLGIIYKNNNLTLLFEFENIGDKPLAIVKVESGCGCIVVDKPKGSVLPNEKAQIEVKFNVNSPENSFIKKDIKVYGNFLHSPKILSFIGKVIKQ